MRARATAWLLLALPALWIGLLSAGYNLFNHFVRHATRRGFPAEMREAIYGVMPWSVAAFVAVTVAFALVLRRGRARAAGAVACGAALQALVCVPFGEAAFATVGLAAAGLVVVASVVAVARLALRRWRQLVAERATAQPVRGRAPGLAVAFVACAAAIALLARQLDRQWRNSLYDNGRWTATKMHVHKALIGSVSFFVTRKALAGGRLNLGAWHGFQEVVYGDAVDARRVAFTLDLVDHAYAALRYGPTGGGFAGVRISRDPARPNLGFRATADGEFVETRPLDLGEVRAGPMRVDLDLDAGALSIDGVAVATLPPRAPGATWIGFRGGDRDAFVDDIEIEGRDGTIHREDWSSPEPGWSTFGIVLLAVLGLGLAIGTRSRRRRPDRPLCFVPLAFAVPATVFAGFVTVIDALVLSRANPIWIDYRGYETRIETEAEVIERARAALAVPAGARRLVALGSSQTWGSGADRPEAIWVAQLERLLNERRDGPPWSAFNGGINGGTSARIFGIYEREWASPPAELVLVDLANNDADPEVLRRALERLIAFHAETSTRTVLILEPNSTERRSAHLERNHAVLREVGAATGTPVIDMMAKLAREADAGFVWWDSVHLTSFGQRRFAELLCAELVERGLVTH